MKRILAFSLALLLSASPVLSAEVGRVQFNGRNVILNDDNTWSYATPQTAAATDPANDAPLTCAGFDPFVSARIKFAACIDPAVWTSADPIGEQEFLAYSADGKTAVTIVTETTVIPMNLYKDAIVAASAASAGVDAATITTTNEGNADYAKHSWGTFRYSMTVEGNAFAYLNYHVSDEALGSVQVVFWTIPGDEATADAQAQALLSQVAFGD